MDDEETSTPITSLVVDTKPPETHRLTHTPSWNTPFLELLRLLKIIDNSKSSPKVDDQRLCFQHSRDLSEISRVFLSVSTSNLKYDIDLKTLRVADSDATLPAVTKLQQYADDILRKTRDFRDCLLQCDIIDDATCFVNVDLSTCPVCHDPVNDCLECDAIIACSNPGCLAALVVECEQCFEHERMVCNACLRKNDTVPPLICCPTCKNWCCREDTYWCAGLVVQPTIGSKELADLSRECDWDNEIIVRSHPPKPSSCKTCMVLDFPLGWSVCRNSADDMKHDRCPAQTPFMTDHRMRAGFCPDCLDASPGCRCACDLAWLCDMCVTVGNRSLDYPLFVTCPRCGVHYCTGPSPSCGNYIDFCRGCNGVRLCNDCQEQEAVPGDIQTRHERPREMVFTRQCNYCEVWSCEPCATSERSARCFHCGEWFCYGCLTDRHCNILRQCPLCGGLVCSDCRMNNRGCAGGMILWAMVPPPPPPPM